LGFEARKTKGARKRSSGESYASPQCAGPVARTAKFLCYVLNRQKVADRE
jgi:hypothetical protein